MKLLLVGYFGSGNIGDEAILSALVSAIKHDHPSAKITVLSEDPAETSSIYGVDSIRKFSFLRIINEVRNSDALIFGGGGLLQDSTSAKSLYYYLFLIFLAKFFGRKVILLGQGIGPVRKRSLLKRALANADLVAVRDEKSMKELAEIGAKPKKLALTADTAFLLPPPDKDKGKKTLDIDGIKKCKRHLIAFALRRSVDDRFSPINYKAIAEACDHLIKEKDSQVAFLIFKYPDDIDAAEKVMGLMKYPAHILLRRCAPAEMLDVISAFDGVVGMRLHSLIFASMAGIPSLGLSYDPKVESFQRSVGGSFIDLNLASDTALTGKIAGFIDNLNVPAFNSDLLAVKARDNIYLMNECLKVNKIRVLGIDIDNITFDEAVKKAEEILAEKVPGLVVTPNPEMIMAAQKDIDLQNIVNTASLAIPDGIGLLIAGSILGRKFKARIAGIDLMLKLVDIANAKGQKIFLFGSAEGVAENAAKVLNIDPTNTFQGYSMNDRLIIDKIKAAKPDILFVGLGSPKQEKWASKHLKELNVPLVMCVGGSFDVIAGKVRRAPVLMRKMGVEWSWRLITEPRRWRRMLVLPKFMIRILIK
jgi:N-acetylglucosaminyldiphosphoundecaprenol N-acetyl-beta-D-mannosaminyltransferase